MANVDPLELAGWRLQIEDLPSEDLPDMATDALVRGLDSPSLRYLAGQNPGDARDSRDLFIRALEELNIPASNPEAAMLSLVRVKATAIVAGDIGPLSGARWLWQASDDFDDEGDLRVFIALASEADEHPENELITKEIVVAASELLDRPRLRRWLSLSASAERSPLTRLRGISYTTVDVELESLPLSSQLVMGLRSWNDDFTRTMNGWPGIGGFESQADAEAFVHRGEQLAAKLQAELGSEYFVLYRQEATRLPGIKLAPSFGAKLRRAIGNIRRRS